MVRPWMVNRKLEDLQPDDPAATEEALLLVDDELWRPTEVGQQSAS